MKFTPVKNQYLFSYIAYETGYWRKKTKYAVSVTYGAHLICGTFDTLEEARVWADKLISSKESRGLRSEKVEV